MQAGFSLSVAVFQMGAQSQKGNLALLMQSAGPDPRTNLGDNMASRINNHLGPSSQCLFFFQTSSAVKSLHKTNATAHRHQLSSLWTCSDN